MVAISGKGANSCSSGGPSLTLKFFKVDRGDISKCFAHHCIVGGGPPGYHFTAKSDIKVISLFTKSDITLSLKVISK